MRRHRCCHCNEVVVWDGHKWVHAEGGARLMVCEDCGWQASPPTAPTQCPACGSIEMIHEHTAANSHDTPVGWPIRKRLLIAAAAVAVVLAPSPIGRLWFPAHNQSAEAETVVDSQASPGTRILNE